MSGWMWQWYPIVPFDVDDYHVFLTAYDQDNTLFVIDRTAEGFRVRAHDPEATGAFSWRVVAKRKDIPAPRFETVTIPPEPTLPSIPEFAPSPSRSRMG